MKFLCVPCDEAMQLIETRGPDRGSMALVYSCPACGYELAMLTNPAETQVVGSLGVKVGSDEAVAAGASKCPFTGVVQEKLGAADEEVRWTPAARQRLDGIPELVRPMAKTGIEKFARDQGLDEVDEDVLEQARSFFGT